MLNTNQSKKHHSWNYLIVLPALIFFMLSYQVEVVAQVKENKTHNKKIKIGSIEQEVTSKTTNQELKQTSQLFNQEFGTLLEFSKIKRNKKGDIISIKAALKDKKSKTDIKTVYEVLGDSPIKSFNIFVGRNLGNNKIEFGYGKPEFLKNVVVIDLKSKDSIYFHNDSIYIIENASEPKVAKENEKYLVELNANTTDEDLRKIQKHYKMRFDVAFIYNAIYRNKENKLTAIDLTLASKNGTSKSLVLGNGKPIQPFTIFATKNFNGQQTFGFGSSTKNQSLEEENEVKNKDETNSYKETFLKNRKSPLEETDRLPENTLFVLNGKVVSEEIFSKLNANSIKSVSVVKRNSNKNKDYEALFEKYGERAKNGIFAIVTDEIQKPVTEENSGWGMDYKTSSSKDNIELIKENQSVDFKKALITLNGKEITSAEMEKIDPESIESVSVFNGVKNEKFIEMYGEKAKYGVILIEKFGYVKPKPVKEEQPEMIVTKFKLDPENGSFTVHKRSGKDDFEFYQKHLATIGINLKIAGIERNKKGFIMSIKFKLMDENLKTKMDDWTTFSNPEGIPDIIIGRKKGKLLLTSK